MRSLVLLVNVWTDGSKESVHFRVSSMLESAWSLDAPFLTAETELPPPSLPPLIFQVNETHDAVDSASRVFRFARDMLICSRQVSRVCG